MDNDVIYAAGGKRKSNNFVGIEELKENVKLQRGWTSRLDDIVGLKNESPQNLTARRLPVDWMRRTPHQKPQMPSVVSQVINYGTMAAAALQDLRAIDPSNHFYQPQKQPQQQLPLQSRQHLPTSESTPSARLLQDVSVSALLPQSPPLRLPLPLIRTPPLYNESDLHNISPTSSSSSPYTLLHNNIPFSHSHASSSSSLQDFSNEQTYATFLQTSQSGTCQPRHQQQPQHQPQHQQRPQHQQQPQQQQQQPSYLPERRNTIHRELQVSTTSWYSSIQTTSTSTESQLVESTSRLQRMDALPTITSSCAPQISTQNLCSNSSLAEQSNQFGFSNSPIIQCSNHRELHRDGFTEQDQQAQFDLQNPSAIGGGFGLMGAPQMCPSPSVSTSSRVVKCSSQNEAHGQGVSLCSQPNAGAKFAMNLSSVVIKAGLDDNGILCHKMMPCPARPVRTYTKVYKLGSITRALDVNRFKNYTELRCELAQMFNLEGQLEQKHGWQLVFMDNENDLLLVGDDPWEEFKITVRSIRILSPREVCFYKDEEQFGTLNSLL